VFGRHLLYRPHCICRDTNQSLPLSCRGLHHQHTGWNQRGRSGKPERTPQIDDRHISPSEAIHPKHRTGDVGERPHPNEIRYLTNLPKLHCEAHAGPVEDEKLAARIQSPKAFSFKLAQQPALLSCLTPNSRHLLSVAGPLRLAYRNQVAPILVPALRDPAKGPRRSALPATLFRSLNRQAKPCGLSTLASGPPVAQYRRLRADSVQAGQALSSAAGPDDSPVAEKSIRPGPAGQSDAPVC